MSDLIKRSDAIEAYADIYWIDDRLNLAFREELDKIDEKIRNIPTVEIADRPRGEWKDTGKDPDHSHPLTAIWYRCSECGHGTNAKTNFCPDCGAEMKGEDNGEDIQSADE